MPAVLIVSRAKRQLRTFALSSQGVTLGRSAQVDLRLDDPDVSRQHATIRHEEGRYFLQDAGSRNGVIVQGKRLEGEVELQEGAAFDVGPFSLAFHLDEASARGADAGEEPATRFISSKDLEPELPGRKIEKKSEPGRLTVKLAVLDGPLKGGAFENWSGDLTIGRGLDNHVVLLDDAVTTYHARIFEKPDGYHIEDLGSHNGTFVQGVKVTSGKLGTSAKIRIGVTTLQFRITDAEKQKRTLLVAAGGFGLVVVLLLLIKMMMPGNVAEQETLRGKELFRARNYGEARKAYEKALARDAGYEPAKAALKEVKTIMEAEQVMDRATRLSEEARFDDALTVAETAIRMAPTYRAASKLKDRIKAMSEAEVAYAARNWSDAARLYKSISSDNPASRLASNRLAVASAELAAMQALAAGRDSVQKDQLALARSALQGIGSQSVYYAAAKQALAAVDWLEGVNRVLATEDTLKLKQTLDLVTTGHDPLKGIDISTEELKGKITLRLQAISQKLATSAKDQVRQGHRVEGFRLYERALEADPANAEAKEASASIRLMIRTECATFMADARKYESLGQKARCVESLQKIMATGIPGEDYYEAAKEKLARLK
jgi:pSer/pThr/pTyr-binding forkhead associated (FHA) protein